jgi:predicted enzyme related to lactoylglutathione lyase
MANSSRGSPSRSNVGRKHEKLVAPAKDLREIIKRRRSHERPTSRDSRADKSGEGIPTESNPQVDTAEASSLSSLEVVSVAPLLHISSVTEAKEFYLDFLGFKVDWEHRIEPGMPPQIQISRGSKLVLQLTKHRGCCSGTIVCILVSKGLEDFLEEIPARGCRYAKPELELGNWGERMVRVTDPFGNRFCFVEMRRQLDLESSQESSKARKR